LTGKDRASARAGAAKLVERHDIVAAFVSTALFQRGGSDDWRCRTFGDGEPIGLDALRSAFCRLRQRFRNKAVSSRLPNTMVGVETSWRSNAMS
jgi:hypothetical protein